MDWSVALQVFLNVSIVGFILYWIFSGIFGTSETLRDKWNDFIRWRQRNSKW